MSVDPNCPLHGEMPCGCELWRHEPIGPRWPSIPPLLRFVPLAPGTEVKIRVRNYEGEVREFQGLIPDHVFCTAELAFCLLYWVLPHLEELFSLTRPCPGCGRLRPMMRTCGWCFEDL